MSETDMTDYAELREEKAATPHNELIAQLLDSRVQKSEREHAAAREIERLREQLRLATVDQATAEAEASDAHAENKRLREALEDIRSRSSINLAMPPHPFLLTARLGEIYQIADAVLGQAEGR